MAVIYNRFLFDLISGSVDFSYHRSHRQVGVQDANRLYSDHPTLESYKFLIENVGLLEKIGNTVLIVGVTIVVSTVICAMAAYGFSRFRTKGISIAFAFIIATMLIPEVVTARPLYDFMRAVGLYDTYPGLIILYISAVIPFTVLILKNFASEIPISLEEAATIDGANFVRDYSKWSYH